MHVHALETPLDPALPGWLDLYQTAFPLDEQFPVSQIIGALQEKGLGGNVGEDFLALLEGDFVVGIAWVRRWWTEDGVRVANLSCLAVGKYGRGQGYGSVLVDRVKRLTLDAGCRLLAIEMARVDVAAPDSESRAEEARRRIRFYRDRHGARLLGGIEHLLHRGRIVPANLMFIPRTELEELSPEAAFRLLQDMFGDDLVQIGKLHYLEAGD